MQLESETAGRLRAAFERGLYEQAILSDPTNVETLLALGDIYSQEGLLDQGLRIDQRLVEIHPSEPVFHYNLACTHSLLGHIDPALQALSRALQLGYNKMEHLRTDPDLENLKKDRRYEEILRAHLSSPDQGKSQIGG